MKDGNPKARVSSYQTRIDQKKREISTLQSGVGGAIDLEEDLKKLEQDFGEAKQLKEKNESKIKSLQDQIKQCENKTKTFEELIKSNGLEKAKKDLNFVHETKKLQDLESKLKEMNKELEIVQEKLGPNKNDLEKTRADKKEC